MEKYQNGQDIRNFNFFNNLETIKVELEDFLIKDLWSV